MTHILAHSDQTHCNASDPWAAPPCRADPPTISQDEMLSLWIAHVSKHRLNLPQHVKSAWNETLTARQQDCYYIKPHCCTIATAEFFLIYNPCSRLRIYLDRLSPVLPTVNRALHNDSFHPAFAVSRFKVFPQGCWGDAGNAQVQLK